MKWQYTDTGIEVWGMKTKKEWKYMYGIARAYIKCMTLFGPQSPLIGKNPKEYKLPLNYLPPEIKRSKQ